MLRKTYIAMAIAPIVFLAFALEAHALPRKKTKRQKRESTSAMILRLYPKLSGEPLSADEPTGSERQNALADEHALPRIKDTAALQGHIKSGYLERLSDTTKTFYIDGHLRKELRYAVPRVKEYIALIAERYCQNFSSKKHRCSRLKVTSLVRTEEYQKKLRRKNRNAAERSVHTTGCAFDISAKGLSRAQLLWLAQFLSSEMDGKVVDALYEYGASHNFHVFVIPVEPAPQGPSGDPYNNPKTSPKRP